MTEAAPPSFPADVDRGRRAAMAAAFFVVFVVSYGGADLLSSRVPWRLRVDFNWEQAIPFWPWTAAVYLSLDLLLLLAPWLLRPWHRLAPLFLVLVVETVVATVVFVALPVELRFPPHVPPGGLFGILFQVADTFNLEHNLFPSLHVAYAASAAWAYGRRSSRAGALLWLGWALAIAASTLLLHQHHGLDVVGGLALAAATWSTVGRWAQQERVLAALDVELLCLENQLRFARRHPRYLLIGLALARASLPRWRRNRVLRTGFCALQAIDDLLDGDRACAGEPLEVVDDLVEQIHSRRFADHDLARLIRAFVHDLEEVGGPPAVADAVRLIRTMQHDRRRRRDGLLLDAASLREHHRLTFHYSVDLMLIAGRCELRAADVQELIEAFGWCSTVRDLRQDLEAGLVNLPSEVVDQVLAELPRSQPADWPSTMAVQRWLDDERRRGAQLLDATDARLEALKHRRGTSTLRMFSRSMRRFTRSGLL